MDRAANNDIARCELIRLLDGLEFYRSWRISSIEREKGIVTEDDLNQIVMPGTFFLEAFDGTKGRGRMSVLKEVQSWYSHTAGDLLLMKKSNDPIRAADAQNFVVNFKQEVGFCFWAEAGLLREMADEAMRLGKIADQDQYYSLRELEIDPSHSEISPDELSIISGLLRDFECQSGEQ